MARTVLVSIRRIAGVAGWFGWCCQPFSGIVPGMQRVPTQDEVRQQIGPLDELDRKVLGGMVALWMADPRRLRDREWVAQQFVQVAVVAHGFQGEGDAASSDDVERVRLYANLRMAPILDVALSLFVRVAEDLRGTQGATIEQARDLVHGYLAE